MEKGWSVFERTTRPAPSPARGWCSRSAGGGKDPPPARRSAPRAQAALGADGDSGTDESTERAAFLSSPRTGQMCTQNLMLLYSRIFERVCCESFIAAGCAEENRVGCLRFQAVYDRENAMHNDGARPARDRGRSQVDEVLWIEATRRYAGDCALPFGAAFSRTNCARLRAAEWRRSSRCSSRRRPVGLVLARRVRWPSSRA